jgi:hypothetical protein
MLAIILSEQQYFKKKILREDTLQLYQFIKCKELFFSKHLGISYRNKKLI